MFRKIMSNGMNCIPVSHQWVQTFHLLLQETKCKLKTSGHRWIVQRFKNVQENNIALGIFLKYTLLEESGLKRKNLLILTEIMGINILI